MCFATDGIVLGFQILSGKGGGYKMIHDHLRHFSERGSGAWGLGLDLGLA